MPLGPPDPRVTDARLAGDWIGVEAGSTDTVLVHVLPFNEAEYYVEVQNKAGAPDRYRAYLFRSEGETILHLNELKGAEPDSSYFFARYSFEGYDRLSMNLVGEKLIPDSLASDARGLAAFLHAHAADPGLNDDESPMQFTRKEE